MERKAFKMNTLALSDDVTDGPVQWDVIAPEQGTRIAIVISRDPLVQIVVTGRDVVAGQKVPDPKHIRSIRQVPIYIVHGRMIGQEPNMTPALVGRIGIGQRLLRQDIQQAGNRDTHKQARQQRG